MTNRDQRIRDIAYFLWLEEGSPEGGAERHWLEAEGMVDSEPEEEARVEGINATAVGGLGMLVHQAAHAFRLWTGCEPPVDAMSTAAAGAIPPSSFRA